MGNGSDGVEVDLSTLQEFADGPLDNAIEKLRGAADQLGEAMPDNGSYPPVAQEAAGSQSDATQQSSETFAGAMDTVVDILERLQRTIQNYTESEDANEQEADDIDPQVV